MRILEIKLVNFRQYYGEIVIPLETRGERNIVLIGGKNGLGKTNLLLSLVWCLFGDDLSKIDDTFRQEIQKEGGYNKFLKGSLNKRAESQGQSNFSVTMRLANVNPSSSVIDGDNEAGSLCVLSRHYDLSNMNEIFEISMDGVDTEMLSTEADKKIFINDYVVPLSAAKFVFFDAEKITNWVQLSAKDEGSVLNDAMGKVMGLELYQALIDDLSVYCDNLRKEGASSQLKLQIASEEKGRDLEEARIENLQGKIADEKVKISKERENVISYDAYLLNYGIGNLHVANIESVYERRNELRDKVAVIEQSFFELLDLMPLMIMASQFEDLVSHLTTQKSTKSIIDSKQLLEDKIESFIEKLFNRPEYPVNDISLQHKMFYAQKARTVMFAEENDTDSHIEIQFEHDLTRTETNLIEKIYKIIVAHAQGGDGMQRIINELNNLKTELNTCERQISNLEDDMQDEISVEYSTKKANAERSVMDSSKLIGSLEREIETIHSAIGVSNHKLKVLLSKVDVSNERAAKLKVAEEYLRVLTDFIVYQKSKKCEAIEKVTYSEMCSIMHRLTNESNDNFISGVKAEVLPDNDGLRVSLLDNNGRLFPKDRLSQGEKQLFISSLIKAILSLSVMELPIIIDTPLGRLDEEHIQKTLQDYYPKLANQVVLLATNNEIPPSRFKMIEKHVAGAFLLTSRENCTSVKQGYFQAYEN